MGKGKSNRVRRTKTNKKVIVENFRGTFTGVSKPITMNDLHIQTGRPLKVISAKVTVAVTSPTAKAVVTYLSITGLALNDVDYVSSYSQSKVVTHAHPITLFVRNAFKSAVTNFVSSDVLLVLNTSGSDTEVTFTGVFKYQFIGNEPPSLVS